MKDERQKGSLMEATFIKEQQGLVQAWENLGYIDTPHAPVLKTDLDAAIMAQVLENVKKYACNMEFRQDIPTDQLRDMLETTTPIKTTAWSGATMIPVVLGFVRKLMPKIFGLELVSVQPMDRPTGRVFYLDRARHDDGTDDGALEARAGWSYRSWIDDPGEVTTIAKSVALTFTSANVSAVSHKLKTQLSAEFQMDVGAYFGMDGLALASDAITDEFAMELNEVILHTLHHNVQTTSYFGSKPSGYTWEEWDRRLLDAIVRTDELAYEKNRTYSNWMVVGSEMSVRLQRLNTWNAIPEGQRPINTTNLTRLGTLNNRWKVYRSALPFPTDELMLGYTGSNWSDSIMYYLPYLPLDFYGRDRNVETLVDTLSWWSRYATYIPTNAANGLSKVVIDETTHTGTSFESFAEWTS